MEEFFLRGGRDVITSYSIHYTKLYDAFLFIEALADGAVRAGMGRKEAIRLAAATVEGAGRMVRETGRHPAELKDMVISPGGTTAAGIAALETGAFRGTVLSAVFAAWQRSRELRITSYNVCYTKLLRNLDFADVKTIMSGSGVALMGTGGAEGQNRAMAAAEKAISSPLLEDVSIRGARGVLFNITAGPS